MPKPLATGHAISFGPSAISFENSTVSGSLDADLDFEVVNGNLTVTGDAQASLAVTVDDVLRVSATATFDDGTFDYSLIVNGESIFL